MKAPQIDIYDYLDLKGNRIKQIVDYVEKHIINSYADLEDICDDVVGNAIIYVDFESYLNIIGTLLF